MAKCQWLMVCFKFSKTLRISALPVHNTLLVGVKRRKSLGNHAGSGHSYLCGLFVPSLESSGVECRRVETNISEYHLESSREWRRRRSQKTFVAKSLGTLIGYSKCDGNRRKPVRPVGQIKQFR